MYSALRLPEELFNTCKLVSVIVYDIAIPIGFEEQQYSFVEDDLLVSTVFVSKGDYVSEQTLNLLVQFSASNFAKEGKKYTIIFTVAKLLSIVL